MTALAPAPAPVRRVPPKRLRTYGAVVTVLVIAVAALDQVLKAWAWRVLGDVHVNSGGNPFTGGVVGGLLTGRVTGAVFDVVDAALVALAGLLLARHSPTRAVALTGGAALAGWASNLGDRLGLHYLTAPDSVRGAVDYLPFAGHYWNLADIVIVTGTAGFVVALLGWLGATAGSRPVLRDGGRRPARRPARRAVLPVALTAALSAVCVLAFLGATVVGHLDGPSSLAAAVG
ncbi:Lipoprotein signal peptidase [Jatrophihabitans endophyticus]|uniref:Lipoprotein signal peptidase n=1 Tax=Jatrophihabitans endophyticus TaxID=1206085 RepID=A0A1M5LKT8_9ACTN|nr:signal peptidase II [Jatrophihabitans endophyticus]SHG65648.1 Lipoprotein signal peptidase [Jatrophihabitans endophyticus]